jgi:hypothetical protein
LAAEECDNFHSGHYAHDLNSAKIAPATRIIAEGDRLVP